jgi:hypothetical protein
MSGACDNQLVNEARLRRALETITLVIDHYGDAYWPIFEVINAELEKTIQRNKKLAEFRPTRRRIKAAALPQPTSQPAKFVLLRRTSTK